MDQGHSVTVTATLHEEDWASLQQAFRNDPEFASLDDVLHYCLKMGIDLYLNSELRDAQ